MLPSSATIECGKCKKRIDVKLTFEEVESNNERGMGRETIHSAEGAIKCGCGNKISYTRSISEYPIGAFNEPIDEIKNGKFV